MSEAPLVTYRVPRQHGALVGFVVQQPLGALAFLVILVMVGAGLLADLVAPYDPVAIDFEAMLGPPSLAHPLGTDAFGRDVLSRIIYGARTALTIGCPAMPPISTARRRG
jgi:peptide/nickel transport system permease protein